MPRRKTLTLDLDSLECGEQIYQLLYDCDELIDYDLSTLKITVQEEIENKIKDIDKVIRNLERYMAINPNYSDVESGNNFVKKQTLAKMLGVSRVTLNSQPLKTKISDFSKFLKSDIFSDIFTDICPVYNNPKRSHHNN